MFVRTTPPFRADHVGSLLRPQALLRAREDHAAGTPAAPRVGGPITPELTTFAYLRDTAGSPVWG